jgi:5-methyltetrahydrofolate--homocysteine methyltransferase
VVGGCCGTTPEHIRELVERRGRRAPLRREVERTCRASPPAIRATDLVQEPRPTMIGERVNAQGSRKVKRHLLEDDYDGVLEVAREQVGGRRAPARRLRRAHRAAGRGGADAHRGQAALAGGGGAALHRLHRGGRDRGRAEQSPGRALVNSINLENGRERVDAVLPLVAAHGAAVIALTIDRDLGGMAKTAETKLEVARKIHDIATEEYGLAPTR